MSGKILGIVGQDPSVFKPNQLVTCCDLSVFFINCGIFHRFSDMFSNFPKVLNLNWLFLNSAGSSVSSSRFSLFIRAKHYLKVSS